MVGEQSWGIGGFRGAVRDFLTRKKLELVSELREFDLVVVELEGARRIGDCDV